MDTTWCYRMTHWFIFRALHLIKASYNLSVNPWRQRIFYSLCKSSPEANGQVHKKKYFEIMWAGPQGVNGFCIHIEAQTKWPPFCRQSFQMNFLEWKYYEFGLKLHWSLFLGFQLTIFQHWFRWWLGADQATSHDLNQWWFVYWHMYALLGLNELNPSRSNETTWCHRYLWSSVQVMAWHLRLSKPLPLTNADLYNP